MQLGEGISIVLALVERLLAAEKAVEQQRTRRAYDDDDQARFDELARVLAGTPEYRAAVERGGPVQLLDVAIDVVKRTQQPHPQFAKGTRVKVVTDHAVRGEIAYFNPINDQPAFVINCDVGTPQRHYMAIDLELEETGCGCAPCERRR